MRRRLSWAAVGTSGVLAVIVATTMTNQSDSAPQAGKIIVPQAGELDGYIPSRDKTEQETVFIPIVPPVAVTSASSTVPPPPPPPKQQRKQTPAPKPKKTTPAPAPPKTTPDYPSYWDAYWSYRYGYYGYGYRDGYYGSGYGYRSGGYRR